MKSKTACTDARGFRGVCVASLLVVFCLSGCGGDQERPDAVIGDSPDSARSSSRQYIEPLLLIPRWPFDDGASQYRLTWSGGDTRLPLFAEPDPNSDLIAELSYEDGDEIEAVGDYLAVYQPAIFRAKKQVQIEGNVYRAGGLPGGQRFSKKLAKGSAVAVYGYAGGENCFLGLGGRIIVAQCPDEENFVGTFIGPSRAFHMQPLDKIWWVQITTPVASGWVPLDDRVIADILPLDIPEDAQIATDGADTAPVDPRPKSDAEAAREDSMFGGDEAEPVAVEESTEPAESDAGLGVPILSDEDIEARLDAKDDPLTVGAYAFLQLQYFALEEGKYEEFTVAAPSLLDVYLDGRPNQRVRSYARGRLVTDFTIPSDAVDDLGEPIPRINVALDQLWMKFDLARTAFVTVGKQRIKWGTGRLWNPTDFLNDERLNPLQVAVLDQRLGVTLAKLHFPLESLGWNFYAIAVLDEARKAEDIGGALRAEFLYGQTEVSLSSAIRRDEPYRFGADLSTGVWLFDLRLEGAALYKDPRSYYRGEIELPLKFPESFTREDEIIVQGLAGLELQIPYRRGDLLTLGAEYFYNDTGYEGADLYPWLFVNDAFVPFYVGRQYAGAYAALLGPGSWDDTNMVVTGLANLSDRSVVARLDISQMMLTYLRWNLFTNVHLGETGEFRYGVEIEPNIFAPEGVDIVRPLFSAGVGLQLDL